MCECLAPRGRGPHRLCHFAEETRRFRTPLMATLCSWGTLPSVQRLTAALSSLASNIQGQQQARTKLAQIRGRRRLSPLSPCSDPPTTPRPAAEPRRAAEPRCIARWRVPMRYLPWGNVPEKPRTRFHHQVVGQAVALLGTAAVFIPPSRFPSPLRPTEKQTNGGGAVARTRARFFIHGNPPRHMIRLYGHEYSIQERVRISFGCTISVANFFEALAKSEDSNTSRPLANDALRWCECNNDGDGETA